MNASALLLLPLSLLLIAGPAEAQFSTGPSPKAQLAAEVSAIAPGETFTLAVTLPHPGGWHSYYLNSSGVELPPSFEWTLPEGFSAGPIQWPAPDVVPGDSGNSLAYEEPPTLLVDITPPASIEAGSEAKISLKAEWQYCRPGQCINAEDEQAITLPVAGAAAPNEANAALFEAARSHLPKPAEGWTFGASREGRQMTLRFEPPEPLAEGARARFVPDERFIEPAPAEAIEARNGVYTLPLTQALEDFTEDEWIEIGDAVSGMLVVESTAAGTQVWEVPETGFTKAPVPALPFMKYLPVLGGMLIGGLILNLMPCVFPVLGLKIMGFVQQSGQDRRKIVLHGVAFAVGVLISFWVVSGILFALRANSAEEITWGYQLQNKWFLYGLVLLFYIFGLSMFGLFEIGASATSVGGKLQSKEGLGGSFFSGVLATIAATPCSAPILGPAIGAAITLPTLQFFTAFTAMALGLALPYLILSIFPKLVDMLPRPGAWMESFKQAMSFLLLGAAAYFFWVYMEHIADDAMLATIAGLVVIAVAAWVYGRWDVPSRTTRTRWTARLLAIAFLATGLFLFSGPYRGLKWDTWNQAKVDSLLESGQPVYVDFTAKWCATCQVNKKVAYSEEVVALFKDRGIVALRADKTRPDPEIDAKIAELGRAAIPVNVLYVPGKEPVITPEALTPGYLKDLIEREIPTQRQP